MNNLNAIRFPLNRTFFIALFFVFSCSEEEPAVVIDPIEVESFSAVDIGNAVSSEDIHVDITFSEGVDEIRLVIIPSSSLNSAMPDEIRNAPAGSFMELDVISSSRKEYNARFTDITDINGAAIVNDVAYSIAIVFTKDEETFVSEEFANITLTDDSPILGKYVGSWNDNLFTNIDVSFILESQNGNRVTGPFFISTNFRPAWGGEENDGTITIDLNEEGSNEIIFRYNQDLPDYMGGCPGLYVGEGSFSSMRINISFTGDDCDGFHENGSIRVDRQF